MRLLSLLTLLSLLSLLHLSSSSSSSATSLGRISVSGKHFIDSAGRVRLFHGFCDTGDETHRYGRFDGTNYLPHTLMSDARNLDILVNEFGFNAFRIGAEWAALQPEPNETDTAYLSALLNATETLGRAGAYAILDMHQDGLSSRVGAYDGIPLWLANRTKFRKPWNGKSGDLNPATDQIFEDLYTNRTGGLAAWAGAWRSFSSTFKAVPSVLAYELINEPFAGDVWTNPLLFDPAYAGSHSLQPAYDVVSAAIREEDQTTVIMFEPVTWGMIWSNKVLGSGFSHVPGGPAYANRSAFSFHYYCRLDSPKNSTAPLSPLLKKACEDGLGPKVFKSVQETMAKIGGASFMTEWGGVNFTPRRTDPDGGDTVEGEWVLAESDRQFQSWTHWSLNFFGPAPATGAEALCAAGGFCILNLVRPYAQAIAGTPVDMRFDPATGTFVLAFQPEARIRAPTEIFLPPYRYPKGYDVELAPAGANFTAALCPGHANKLCVRGGGGGGGDGASASASAASAPAAAVTGAGGSSESSADSSAPLSLTLTVQVTPKA